MRLKLRLHGKARTDQTQAFVGTIDASKVVAKLPSKQGKGARVRKAGRIVEVQFPLELDGRRHVAALQLSTSEIFLLTGLCRDDRDDGELLNAIAKATKGEPEGRKRSRSVADQPVGED